MGNVLEDLKEVKKELEYIRSNFTDRILLTAENRKSFGKIDYLVAEVEKDIEVFFSGQI